METLVIGKPAINVYLPLQEYPQEGDLFIINSKNESLGNVGATSACLLGKWGEKVHFTGVVGNDSYAEKVRDTFKSYNVGTKHIETNFSTSTSTNYITLNVKTGSTTKVLYNDVQSQLTKYRYDFIPGFAIIDGTDFAGAHALLNNNGTCKTMFYARRGDKDTIAISKKCSYVVCTESFVEGLTHMKAAGSAESYVSLYQKIVDVAGNSNYIVILNNHKILYAVDGAVKMLPEMKINIADFSSFDSIFVGAISFALIHELNLDDAIKFANTAAAISLTKVGEEAAIPAIEEVLDNSGLREKFGLKSEMSTQVAQAQGVSPLMSSQQNNIGTTSENPSYQEEMNNFSNTSSRVMEEVPSNNTVVENQNVNYTNENYNQVSNQNDGVFETNQVTETSNQVNTISNQNDYSNQVDVVTDVLNQMQTQNVEYPSVMNEPVSETNEMVFTPSRTNNAEVVNNTYVPNNTPQETNMFDNINV